MPSAAENACGDRKLVGLQHPQTSLRNLATGSQAPNLGTVVREQASSLTSRGRFIRYVDAL